LRAERRRQRTGGEGAESEIGFPQSAIYETFSREFRNRIFGRLNSLVFELENQTQVIRLSLQNIPIDLQSLKLIDVHLFLRSAQPHLFTAFGALASMFKTSAQLRLENLALRQQLTVLRRSAPKRLKLTPTDRISWVWLHRVWADWKSALMIVKAETVVAWHRKGFRLFWTWKIHRGKAGRPSVPHEVRDPRGKGPMSNGSLGSFAASVWIISSSSANVPRIVRSRVGSM